MNQYVFLIMITITSTSCIAQKGDSEVVVQNLNKYLNKVQRIEKEGLLNNLPIDRDSSSPDLLNQQIEIFIGAITEYKQNCNFSIVRNELNSKEKTDS